MTTWFIIHENNLVPHQSKGPKREQDRVDEGQRPSDQIFFLKGREDGAQRWNDSD